MLEAVAPARTLMHGVACRKPLCHLSVCEYAVAQSVAHVYMEWPNLNGLTGFLN